MSEPTDRIDSARLFIALAVPEEVKDRLGMVQKELSEQLHANEIRWVRPELIHLTLKFLGNVVVGQLLN